MTFIFTFIISIVRSQLIFFSNVTQIGTLILNSSDTSGTKCEALNFPSIMRKTFSRSQEKVTALLHALQSSCFFVFLHPRGVQKTQKINCSSDPRSTSYFFFVRSQVSHNDFRENYSASFCAYGILTVQNTSSYLPFRQISFCN